MSPVLGENVPLQIYKDGDYTDYACITDCGVDFSTETIETRTVGDGYHAKPAGQSLSYQVTGAGLIELQQVSPVAFWLLQNYHQQMLPVQFQMLFEDPVSALVKILRGTALITNFSIVAGSTGFATADFTMAGIGAIEILDTATVCAATMDPITVNAGVGFVDIDYTGVTAYVERLDYTINDGGRETVFLTGTSGTIPLGDLAPGVYTVVVYPICPNNGLDGEAQSITFEIEEGGEVTECSAPVAIYVDPLEPTSAIVQWDYFGDWPAGGFGWLLIDFTIGSEVQAGTAMTNGTDLSGLVPGHDYQFRVRTICDSGVSESGYFLGNFTTPSDEPDPLPNGISYGFFPGESSGSLTINKNGVEVVFVDELADSFFASIDGDLIEIIGTGTGTVDIHVVDTTSSTIIINHNTGSGSLTRSFTTASGHNYNIDVTIT